jgi:tyrosyl-tRNA synthetase
LSRAEVEALDGAVADRPEARDAQRALAADVTSRVHGADATRVAADASKLVFDRSADPHEFSPSVLEALVQELPSAILEWNGARDGGTVVVAGVDRATTTLPVKVGADGLGIEVLDAFVVTGLVKSKGEARRLLQQGGLYANGDKLSPELPVLPAAGAIHGQYYVLRKGARDIAIVRLAA